MLKDDERLAETSSGLTLVMSSLPSGCFTVSSKSMYEEGHTTVDVTAEFQSDGAFRIAIRETKDRDDEDDEPDPYEAGAAWDQKYTGTCVANGQDLRLAISDSDRKGYFDHLPPLDAEFRGTYASASELQLRLPLAAEGTADLALVSLQKAWRDLGDLRDLGFMDAGTWG